MKSSSLFGQALIAILLIAAILSREELERLRRLAARYEMDALVEVHDEVEVQRALAADARLIGINARNLKTLEVDMDTFGRIAREEHAKSLETPRF